MEIVSSLHVLNVHIQYVHYTHTYSKTLHGWLPTSYSCSERLSQTKMSSEFSAVKTAAFQFFCCFGRPLQKTEQRERLKKKSWYLIELWLLWMRPIKSHFVLLCLYCPPNQFTASTLVFILYLDWSWNISSYWKSACSFSKYCIFLLKSKYKI